MLWMQVLELTSRKAPQKSLGDSRALALQKVRKTVLMLGVCRVSQLGTKQMPLWAKILKIVKK